MVTRRPSILGRPFYLLYEESEMFARESIIDGFVTLCDGADMYCAEKDIDRIVLYTFEPYRKQVHVLKALCDGIKNAGLIGDSIVNLFCKDGFIKCSLHGYVVSDDNKIIEGVSAFVEPTIDHHKHNTDIPE